MSTKIEWAEETWNPILGCSRVSPGCDLCYAIGVAHRKMQPAHVGLTVKRPGEPTDWTGVVRCLPDRLEIPLRWRRPRRVFVNSMSDLFHNDVPGEFIAEVFAAMVAAGHHTFQVLTKRPQRMARLVGAPLFRSTVEQIVHRKYDTHMFAGWPYPSIWLGTSIESDRYSWRADYLRETPAAVRFLSVEPLIAPVWNTLDVHGLDWVIVGAESGPGARPMDLNWVRMLRDDCEGEGVAFFVKQLSGPGGRAIKDIDQFPEDLRIREYPT